MNMLEKGVAWVMAALALWCLIDIRSILDYWWRHR